MFQLAHVVEGMAFDSATTGNAKSKQEWAAHQIASTSNFGTSSKCLYWLLGGLNFQIEHHLFPRISHIHYPAISVFVKETCRKSGITYHEHSSMLAAIISHVVYLYSLGRAPIS